MVYKIAISSSDINEIEYNLKRKGFQLDEISYSINNYAIAQISAIDKENDEDNEDEFNPSSYTVIIDVKKKACCKFDFYGHKTDGIKILAKPKKGKHFIFYPYFDIKFISTIGGKSTPHILVTYIDYCELSMFMQYEYNRNNKTDYDGYIYACIFELGNNSLVLRSSSKFKFNDWVHYENSVEVCLIDPDCLIRSEDNFSLFAYKQLSKNKYDSEYDIKREYMYDFDGIWNTSLYCTDRRIIPLEGDDFFDVVNDIDGEIRAEISQELEERRQIREEEYDWRLEQDMLEYDNRAFNEMIDDYEAWGNID
ncbi:MAG: hypothetical protein IKJ20_08275 [Alistipes sp.]|nr:hypothetical protein [Alistipes sp.]